MKGRNRGFAFELIEFVIENKKWWIFPLILALIMVGSLILFATSSSVAPFIYPMI